VNASILANLAHVIGAMLFGFAALIAVTNFHLSFVRPLYFRWKKKEYKFISGLPAIGTIALIFSGFLLPPNLYLACSALLLVVLDTGGLPWFAVIMLVEWLRGRA